MNLRDLRNEYGLSQATAANIAGVPLRTYVRYEANDDYGDSLKRQMIIKTIVESCEITETKGLLSVEQIKQTVSNVLDGYKGEIDFCYLFGSYCKGYAKENSDVDLCISCSLTGLDFVGLIENLRVALHKKVDLIRFDTLSNNVELIKEIMKDGIKIYEQHQR